MRSIGGINTSPNIPVHVGFIMDGNGRWAAKRGMPRTFGHHQGAKTFKSIVDSCRNIGIKFATFYAFSTENWQRPKDEVDELMNIFRSYLDQTEEYTGKKTRVVFLGNKEPFPDDLKKRMLNLERESAQYNDFTLMLAMNYGGRDDIVNAAKRAAELVADGTIKPSDIDGKLMSGLMYTGNAPDADLIVRTSGEKRISNFLLWQSAYAEYYFTDVLWPDFSKRELEKALDAYAERNRRFGGV